MKRAFFAGAVLIIGMLLLSLGMAEGQLTNTGKKNSKVENFSNQMFSNQTNPNQTTLNNLTTRGNRPTSSDTNRSGIKKAKRAEKAKVQAGVHIHPSGKKIRIRIQANNRIKLEVGNISANCSLNLTQERVQNRTRLYAKLSNGKYAEIKIMPDVASQTAIERLRLKNCNNESCHIELKEVGSKNQSRVVYEIRAKKRVKILGLFRKSVQFKAEVDAEKGDILSIKKPWWMFLASESKEQNP